MNETNKSFKETLKTILNKAFFELKSFGKWIKNVFNSYSDTATLLFGIFIIFTLVIFFICFQMGGFFTINTDDIAQYYPIMAGFIKDLKNGELSLYNNSFFAGASFFANSYYIPLDIFTLLTYLFSFIMKTETAYGLVNLMKIGSGGMMMSYYMHNHGFKNKTVFFFSLIFAFGGLMTAECVFPVYWSLLFYIPLGLFVIDKYLENHYNFYLIPIYTFIIVLYDFYIAYMLLALLMIYLVMIKIYKGNSKIFGKNTIFKDKLLYIDTFSTLGLIFIGLMMSMCVFLPSYKYITGKTIRNTYKEVLSHYKLSHYVTILSTYFTVGSPLNVLLKHGDYIRNHASMFITLFGLMCLVTLYTMKGYKNRYLKIIIILSNILLGIPAISMLMTGTNQAYIRWFFIVYIINLYGAAVAFDANDDLKLDKATQTILLQLLLFGFTVIFFLFFKNGQYENDSKKSLFLTILVIYLSISALSVIYYAFLKKKALSIIYDFIFVFLTCNLATYILIKDDSFSMYDGSEFYWPVLIVFLSFVSLYLIAIFIPKRKVLMYVLLGLEICASMIMTFVNCAATGSYYYFCQDEFSAFEINLKATTSYSNTNAYRVSIYTNESVYMTNLSFIYDKFNTTQFFHSFYDSTINDLYGKLYEDNDTTNWHRREIMTYAGPYAIIDGVKYVVVPNYKNTPMPSFYEEKFDDTNYKYYEIKDLKPFIVYDKIGSKSGYSYLKMANVLTQIGYFDKVYNMSDDVEANLFNELIMSNNLKAASDQDFSNLSSVISKSIYNPTFKEFNGVKYAVYNWNITMPESSDSIMITPTLQYERLNALNDAFITDEFDNIHHLYAGYTAYDHSYTPKQLWVKSDNETSYNINASAFSFNEIYNLYLESQKEFKDEYFSLEGSKMKISLSYDKKDYNRVLKTNFAYSSEWKVNDSSIKTINVDGGYLGIILPSDTTSCNIELNFEPDGLNLGLTISGFFIGLFSTACVLVFLERQRKKDINNLF